MKVEGAPVVHLTSDVILVQDAIAGIVFPVEEAMNRLMLRAVTD